LRWEYSFANPTPHVSINPMDSDFATALQLHAG
jgi:hypothetical protein